MLIIIGFTSPVNPVIVIEGFNNGSLLEITVVIAMVWYNSDNSERPHLIDLHRGDLLEKR